MLRFLTPRGEVAICCPITGRPLTAAMAAAAGIERDALADMLAGRRPLGVASRERWRWACTTIANALREPNGAHPALAAGGVQAKLGGSAVACFSSAQTATEKKRFPADEAELEAMVRSSPLNRGLPAEALAALVGAAVERYRALGLDGRPPVAPWFNILSRLGRIEEPADLDIQIHSDIIDSVMTRLAATDPAIDQRRRTDRLGRWDETDVYRAFPALLRLLRELQDGGLNIGLEFLGPGGDATMRKRTDWWTVVEHDPA